MQRRHPLAALTRHWIWLVVLVFLSTAARAGDVSVQLDSGAGFALKNSTGAIERLRIHEATGNVSRNGALFVHTTGFDNLFLGQGAGNPGLPTTSYSSR